MLLLEIIFTLIGMGRFANRPYRFVSNFLVCGPLFVSGPLCYRTTTRRLEGLERRAVARAISQGGELSCPVEGPPQSL